MSQPLLEMKGITKYIFDSYGVALRNTTVKILDQVDFSLNAGEVHILVGENGAGKSTLMKVLGGVIPPDEGTMTLAGQPVRPRNPREAQALGIGFVHQELNLCANLSVADNIFIGCELTKGVVKDKKRMAEEARRLLVGMGIDIDPQTPVKALSTAQQQIVEIAKVLKSRSRIIIMDEPTSSLTKKEIDILFGLIKQLKQSGVSIIYISHRLEEFDEIGDRLSVLRDGRSIGTLKRAEFETDRIVSMMVGRPLGEALRREKNAPGETVLEVTGMRLEPHTAPIDIRIAAGEIVGFGGLVGAGRTELAKSIIGIRRHAGGTVKYRGQTCARLDPAPLIRDGMVYLTEDRKTEGLILDMGIRENTSLMSLLKMFKRLILIRSREAALARDTVKRLNIACSSIEQLARTLSGGNQQKVVLGKCLAADPKLLILDEPTRGIDVGAKREIYRMIDEIARAGVAVMMISSDMPELISLSDRIYVMKDGAVVAELIEKAQMTQEVILGHTIG